MILSSRKRAHRSRGQRTALKAFTALPLVHQQVLAALWAGWTMESLATRLRLDAREAERLHEAAVRAFTRNRRGIRARRIVATGVCASIAALVMSIGAAAGGLLQVDATAHSHLLGPRVAYVHRPHVRADQRPFASNP